MSFKDSKKLKGKAVLYRARGFQEVKAARFRDIQHLKLVRLSALNTIHL
jgi:hypothetical protein